MTARITLIALEGLPLVKAGDDLASMIADGLAGGAIEPRADDILVVAQKIVSQTEGRIVGLSSVTLGARG